MGSYDSVPYPDLSDLFANVGYQLETEEIFQGAKNGVDLEVLISLFVKTRHE